MLLILTGRHDNSHKTFVLAFVHILSPCYVCILKTKVLCGHIDYISPPAQPNDRYGCLPSKQQIQKNRNGSPEGRNVIAIWKFTFASVHNHPSQQLSALIPHSSQPFSFHFESKVKGLGNKILQTNCGCLSWQA